MVLLDITDGVARVTINQPARANTLTPDVQDLLEEGLGRIERDESIFAVVLTGAGERQFCGGLHSDLVTGENRHRAHLVLERAWRLAKRVADLRPVVIGGINGAAYAGGFALAMACDLTVASENATFTYPGTEYGLTVGTFQLPYLIGPTWAKEVILLAKTVTAADAYRMGMVNQVVPLAELPAAVEALVDRCRALSPIGLKNAKLLINRAVHSHPDDAFEREIEWLARFAGSDHVQENFGRAIAQRKERSARRKTGG